MLSRPTITELLYVISVSNTKLGESCNDVCCNIVDNYGTLTAIGCGIPAVLLFGFWLAFESSIITQLVVAD